MKWWSIANQTMAVRASLKRSEVLDVLSALEDSLAFSHEFLATRESDTYEELIEYQQRLKALIAKIQPFFAREDNTGN